MYTLEHGYAVAHPMSREAAKFLAMYLAQSFRLLPTKRQHVALNRILESQRQLYNAALEERIDAYRKQKINRSYVDQTKALTEWRLEDEAACKVPVNLQRGTLQRLDRAFRGFFSRLTTRKKAGFPRFKGKGWFTSFEFRQFSGITLHGDSLRFKGLPGRLRVHFHREAPAVDSVRACVFVRDEKGWRISFITYELPGPLKSVTTSVGLDLGIARFATLSNGQAIPSLRAARRAANRIRRAQRALRRKERFSRCRQKAVLALRRAHATVKRQRTNFLHQASAKLVKDYDRIAVEALHFRGLAAGALAKDVNDAAWSRFISMLRYKAERAGGQVVEVDPRNTSQLCSKCGIANPKPLEQRIHVCSSCGLRIDRDINAALNILNRAGVGPSLRNDGPSDVVQAESPARIRRDTP